MSYALTFLSYIKKHLLVCINPSKVTVTALTNCEDEHLWLFHSAQYLNYLNLLQRKIPLWLYLLSGYVAWETGSEAKVVHEMLQSFPRDSACVGVKAVGPGDRKRRL